MNFLCGDISEDGEEQLGLSILANILLHMPTSPFYKTLIESWIAASYSPGCGYDH